VEQQIVRTFKDLVKTSKTLPRGAQAGDLIMEPCTYRAKRGRLRSVEYAADCGTLVVSENREKPSSRLIALPVLRIHATGNAPAEPIFYLAGGPGASNMCFVPPDWLLEKHDFVLVGYRGADGSVVLDCPEISRAVRGVGDDVLGDASRANITAAIAQSARRLQEEGVDLAGYTIAEVVEDMEAARTGLGYERINLLSQSYGTRVAQIYAWTHPDSLFRSAMISVNPPGHFVWEPKTIDAQLAYYAALWAQDPACVARAPDLLKTIRAVRLDVPRRWLFLPIDPGKVRITTFALLYHRGTAAQVFDAYVAADRGDPSGLALMSLVYNFTMPGMIIWGDMLAKGSCADYDPSRDYADLDPPDTILGSPMSQLLWPAVEGGWPIKLMPAELRQVQPSDVETLLVSGSIDFSTPAHFATEELLPHLSNGKQVILEEFGHTADVWKVQPETIERLLTSFYEMGVADDSLYTYEPMNFHVRLGFPQLAKIALAAVQMLLLIVLALLWFVVRRGLGRRRNGSNYSDST
jgi:pimeloyl-ACP methyl ester carboxylesterase